VSEREAAAKELAEAMGWTWTHPSGTPDVGYSWFTTNDVGDQIMFPLASRPLHEHLAFVGRIAEAVGRTPWLAWDERGWPIVSLGDEHTGIAADLSWAALIAATAAKKGTP
jgi:hypothetical protein